ncbi:MAG: hypothetical protein GXZ18_00490 [Synergistaceae bacterium]|nr:hypothetical protein [Synergistaceae bacterium]
MNNIYILSNSPGEVSGWVKPVAFALCDIKIEARVTLVILPCNYASGMEANYGKELAGIDETILFSKLFKTSSICTGKNIVLQLGGDPMFGAMLSAKFRGKWFIYTSRPRWRFLVDHYFVPDKTSFSRFVKKKVNESKITISGNLMFDSVPECGTVLELKNKLSILENEEAISLLAGSRPFEYYEGFSFFINTAKKILSETNISHVFLPIAPTVDEQIFHDGLRHCGVEWIGEKAEEVKWNGPGRIRFIRGNGFEAIKVSKLAVALPGTNNLQIASFGVPLLVVAPLNQAENIPLDGVAGLIPMSIPGAKKLKKKLVMWYNSREEFVSLTNRIIGKNVVPEHRYIMTPEMVATLAMELLESPEKLNEIKEGYSALSFERGAAKKIALFIDEYLKGQ